MGTSTKSKNVLCAPHGQYLEVSNNTISCRIVQRIYTKDLRETALNVA